MPEFDFKIVQNNDVSLKLHVYDLDTGELVNLTGAQSATVSMFAKNSPTAVLTKTLVDGIALTTPLEGLMTMTIDKEDIEDISGVYVFDGKVVDSNGKSYNIRKYDSALGTDQDFELLTCKILESKI